jgi:membrane-bound lytic murein transglycosylase D
VGSHADERTNPAKATDAALAYLDELHDQFGSWYLAAAAYNAGPGTVARALQRVTNRRTGTDADFYRIAPRLPRETRDYVPKLIAAARIGKQPGSYGFTD